MSVRARKDEPAAEPQPGEETEPRRLRFRAVPVFDVSQTDPLPGTEPGPAGAAVASRSRVDPRAPARAARRRSRRSSGTRYLSAPLDGSADGWCDSSAARDRRQRERSRRTRRSGCSSMRSRTPSASTTSSTAVADAEVLVDTVTFIVCGSVGLDVSGSSVPYVAGWGESDDARRDPHLRRDDRPDRPADRRQRCERRTAPIRERAGVARRRGPEPMSAYVVSKAHIDFLVQAALAGPSDGVGWSGQAAIRTSAGTTMIAGTASTRAPTSARSGPPRSPGSTRSSSSGPRCSASASSMSASRASTVATPTRAPDEGDLPGPTDAYYMGPYVWEPYLRRRDAPDRAGNAASDPAARTDGGDRQADRQLRIPVLRARLLGVERGACVLPRAGRALLRSLPGWEEAPWGIDGRAAA